MFNISKFLDKFSKKIDSEEIFCKKIAEIIKEKIQTNIELKDIEIKNGVIYIALSPAIKNKVYIFKEEMLKEINLLGFSKISDIR